MATHAPIPVELPFELGRDDIEHLFKVAGLSVPSPEVSENVGVNLSTFARYVGHSIRCADLPQDSQDVAENRFWEVSELIQSIMPKLMKYEDVKIFLPGNFAPTTGSEAFSDLMSALETARKFVPRYLSSPHPLHGAGRLVTGVLAIYEEFVFRPANPNEKMPMWNRSNAMLFASASLRKIVGIKKTPEAWHQDWLRFTK